MSAPGFSGFAIAKKPAAKPTGRSNLATSSALSSTTSSASSINKHEEFRKTTEAAKWDLKKEDADAISAALEEDPSLFDYGDYYDEMQSKIQQKKKPVIGNAKYGYGITVADSSKAKAPVASAPQSRYIDSLLAKARERESERELVLERQRHKENQKYEELYGETESFVTPEYQIKLEEDRKKSEELDQRDRADTASSSMNNFYTNLRRATVGGNSDVDSEVPTPSTSIKATEITSPSSLSMNKTEDTTSTTSISSQNDENNGDHSGSSDNLSEQPTSSKPPVARQSLIAQTVRKPRRHTEEMIDAARQRYHQRLLSRPLDSNR